MLKKPFAGVESTPANHFKLYFYAAVIHMLEQLSSSVGSLQGVLQKFPFLEVYCDELTRYGVESLASGEVGATWSSALLAWERAVCRHLPLRALAETVGLDHAGMMMVILAGMSEEDSRFAYVFEAAHGISGQPSTTPGLLQAWFGELQDVRHRIRKLQSLGLFKTSASGLTTGTCGLQVPAMLWDAMRGDVSERPAPWAWHQGPDRVCRVEQLILPAEIELQVQTLPSLFATRKIRTLIVRGPQHNGRRTMLGAVAAMLERGVLEISSPFKPEDDLRSLAGLLATLLHAMPVVRMDLAPGETVEAPVFSGYDGPIGIVLNRHGGLTGPEAEHALTLTLPMPDETLRRCHWAAALRVEDACDQAETAVNAAQLRMSSGNLRRTVRLAVSYARVQGRTHICMPDVREAAHVLNRHVMETLAQRVPAGSDWNQLAVASQTLTELHDLESRCRQRERLCLRIKPELTANLNAGVRALFSGPSGTGKTLAAQILASRLEKDLYRLDLSMVVNKYIGETEKNLSQIFARAEELDVVLLLDEGDALLTQRTAVQTSNDRYANLETNYLLQRLETFEGILIVTTNAADRIDRAFQRRMDVVVDFQSPEAPERWNIWQMHLPADHQVDDTLLCEIAGRCVMTGGQIRNAALHASVLALENGGFVTSAYLESAVQREYRKLGAVCPLRRPTVSAALREH